MTVWELKNACGLQPLVGDEAAMNTEVSGCYIGDLLSWAMSRAGEHEAWITVMGNVNAVADAALADCACIILCDRAPLDDDARARADIPVFMDQVAETVGNANTFLSMTMIGLGLELHMTREQTGSVAKILGTRFAVSAVLAVLFYRFLPFSLEIRRTLAILMFGPVSALGVPYTSMLEGDVNLASAVHSASIILGIVSLTAAIIVFQ